MVDWDTHRIIDMIPSRESTEVSVWLSTSKSDCDNASLIIL
ncbi:hypothetical protein [Ruminococcus albus]|nr:hypothetical protein [Ruminococcus albus]